MNLRQLTRIRWGVRAALVLGVATSVAANVLHANPNPISQAIAAWPPLALLLTVELISRVPVHHRSLAVVRLAATAAIVRRPTGLRSMPASRIARMRWRDCSRCRRTSPA